MKLILIIVLSLSISTFAKEYSISEELENLPYLDFNRVDRLSSSLDKTANNADDSGNLGIEDGKTILFDSYGPGEIFRIWRTVNNDSLFFYFDGEDQPSLSLGQFELFLGIYEGSEFPLSFDFVEASGGSFSYARIRYNKQLKILTNSQDIGYFHIDYAEYSNEKDFENGIYSPKEPASFIDSQSSWPDISSSSSQTFEISELSSSMSHTFNFQNGNKTRIKKLELNISDLIVGDSLDRIFAWSQSYRISSSFNMELNPENEGIMLIKRLDPKAGTIPTEVLIDGESASTFSGKDWNYNYRFVNDTTFINKEFTSGKDKINIKIKPIEKDAVPNESYFWIKELIGGEYQDGDQTSIYWWEGGKSTNIKLKKIFGEALLNLAISQNSIQTLLEITTFFIIPISKFTSMIKRKHP